MFRGIHGLLLLALAGAYGSGALAQSVGEERAGGSGPPIKIVVPFPPGGIVDVTARMLADNLTESLRRPVVVENKTGAGGNIASGYVARAKPDGSVYLVTSNNHSINHYLYPDSRFDAIKDLQPVSLVADAPMVLAVRADLPASTLDELLAMSRNTTKPLTFGSGGIGHPGHIGGELLKVSTDLDFTHVPYKGSGPVTTDLVGGQIDMAIGSVTVFQPFFERGSLKPIGLTTNVRWKPTPDISTLEESGAKGYHYSAWIGLLAPSGVPLDEIEKMQAEVERIMKIPEVREKLVMQGAEPVGSSTQEFSDFLQRDFTISEKIIKSGNIKGN